MMYTHTKIVICSVLVGIVSYSSADWSPLTMTVLTSELHGGDELHVDCTYETPYMTSLDHVRTFSWTKDDVIIHDGSRQTSVEDDRYSVATEPNWIGINSLLVVRNLTREDEGNYSCVFDENGATATSEAIRLYYPPSPGFPKCSFQMEDGEQFGLPSGHQIMELACTSDGFPPVDLSWSVRSRDGRVQPIRGRQDTSSSLVRNIFRFVVDQTLNGKTFVCRSGLVSGTDYGGECEIGPIFVTNQPAAIETVDDGTPTQPVSSSSMPPRTTDAGTTKVVEDLTSNVVPSTSNGHVNGLTTRSKSTEENFLDPDDIDPPSTEDTDDLLNDSNRITSIDTITTPLLLADGPRASIECECKLAQDYLQLSLFVLIPVLLLSMLFNTVLCVRGLRPKPYPLQVDTAEVTGMEVFSNRRTETIMRNERETASNDYSLESIGDIYAAIDTQMDTTRDDTHEYQQRRDIADIEDYDDDEDDDDYFNDDIDYSHAVYDNPPEEGGRNTEYYFDAPPVVGS